MLDRIIYPLSGEYRTGTQNEPLNFFADVLPESKQFDILLGYFSSSAIRVLAFGFAKFLHNGGRGRFVINHILSEKDKAAILRGEQNSASALDFAMTDYLGLKKSLDTEGVHFFNCLAWMIASKRVEIVAVRPKEGSGIAHQKTGIFSDGQNEVLFDGSCNFTAMALLGNIEKLSTRFSWENSARDIAAIEEGKVYFNQIFDKKADFVEYLAIENLETAIKTDFGNKDLDDLLIDEITLLTHWQKKLKTNPKFKKRLEELEKELQILRGTPRFPYADGARPYQIEAYQNWLANDHKGIFAMATGTGKTITALNCVLEEYRKNPEKQYHAVILVPTVALVEQWEKEIKKFNFSTIIKVSSKTQWKDRLGNLTMQFFLGSGSSFFIVCSYATFYRPKFQKYFKDLPKDTILIADEAHNLGSSSVLAVLPKVHLNKRIGLSATPKRIYDLEGTAEMEAFFNDKEPYVFNFSVEEAIENGFLCNYKYYPHLVALTDLEFEKYTELSQKLLNFFDFKTGSYKDSDIVFRLLLARKRVIQKAENKLAMVKDVLKKRFDETGNLKYSFVFVPEGISTSETDTTDENEDDIHLIDQYVQAIAEIHPSVIADSFTSKTPNREETLRYFEKGMVHALASMKCLDEGVDIPRTELAVFCASTGNPRQFIQRRGRVLRMHKDKHLAEIHDLVVVPFLKDNHRNDETFLMERSLVRKELERVVHFAFLSLNPYESIEALRDVCEYYELDLFAIQEQINKSST